ncbi:hypothetical protein OYT88_04615 [Sporolactobacillus sp. CQH2019]|uniref:hypothetical protein n=1 Tax=Sporolactobacillus sp. CQH2019 TaxID=3023512 RepID=UPI0023686CE6|nr:hypothetical protein [Sporolactobacillus sp. CQH2019]MDD9147832.1 hypothetical protein [Sporolactobacillus sp. CQH2019]
MSIPYRLNLQYFAEGDPADPQPTPPQGGGDPQPSNPNKGGSDPQSNNPDPQPSADDIKASILKELGVDNLDAAKQSLTAFKEYQESQKTESQKLQDQAAELQKQLDAANAAKTLADAKIAALAKGVRPDAVDDVIKMVSGAKDIGKAVDEVLKKYPVFGSEGQQTPPASPGHPQWGQQNYNQKTQQTEVNKFIDAFKKVGMITEDKQK